MTLAPLGANQRITHDRIGITDELIRDAKIGLRPALEHLLLAYQPFLLQLAKRELGRQLKTKADWSDIVQQSCLDLQQSIGGFRGTCEAELTQWLRRIVLNNIYELQRRYYGCQKRHPLRESNLDGHYIGATNRVKQTLFIDADPALVIIAEEEAEQFEYVLSQLPKDYQRVILLRGRCQQSFNQVGSELGCSADAARKLWNRAIEALKTRLSANQNHCDRTCF